MLHSCQSVYIRVIVVAQCAICLYSFGPWIAFERRHLNKCLPVSYRPYEFQFTAAKARVVFSNFQDCKGSWVKDLITENLSSGWHLKIITCRQWRITSWAIGAATQCRIQAWILGAVTQCYTKARRLGVATQTHNKARVVRVVTNVSLRHEH